MRFVRRVLQLLLYFRRAQRIKLAALPRPPMGMGRREWPDSSADGRRRAACRLRWVLIRKHQNTTRNNSSCACRKNIAEAFKAWDGDGDHMLSHFEFEKALCR